MTPAVQEQGREMAEQIERVLVGGDLGKLSPEQRVHYVRQICESVGLNPLTRPFDYILLQGKLTLYAKKDATDQLRAKYGISIEIVSREVVDGVYVVVARAFNPAGRQDESIGALPLPTGAADKANAIMKCETKAKRRVTLSMCGLGMLDESETDTIPGAQAQVVAQQRIEELKQRRQIAASEPEPEPEVFTPSPELIRELGAQLEAPASDSDGGIEARATQKAAEAAAVVKEAQSTRKAAKKGPALVSGKMLQEFGAIKDKIWEEQGEPPCPSCNGNKGDRDDCMDCYATGQDYRPYYAILKRFGYERSNQIPSTEKGAEVYKALKNELIRLRSDKLNRAEIEEIAQKMGPNRFWDICGRDLGIDPDAYEGATGETLTKMLEVLRAVK